MLSQPHGEDKLRKLMLYSLYPKLLSRASHTYKRLLLDIIGRFKLRITLDQVLMLFEAVREDLQRLKEVIQVKPQKAIRVNTTKITPIRLKRRLEDKGVVLKEINDVPYAFRVLHSDRSLASFHEYMLGYYYIQSVSSLYPVLALKPEETRHGIILDLCCGAGGKTTHISQLATRITVIGIDKNPRKLRALKIHVERLGLTNIIAVIDDATQLNSIEDLIPLIRKVLVDAPCSGLGLIGKKLTPRRYSEIVDRVLLQYRILRKVLELVTRYERLERVEIVYSTCSLSIEENELVLDTLLNEFKDVISIASLELGVGEQGFTDYLGYSLDTELLKCRRLYPDNVLSEGFFICKLVVNAS